MIWPVRSLYSLSVRVRVRTALASGTGGTECRRCGRLLSSTTLTRDTRNCHYIDGVVLENNAFTLMTGKIDD